MPLFSYNIISSICRRAKPFQARAFITAALFAFAITKTSAQAPDPEPILLQFKKYTGAGIQEKIYLHSDKQFYLAGEICWFKLYCVDALFHRPLTMSKVAYTEIIDEKNKPVLQAKISLSEGSGNGSFQLPKDMPSGKYKIRSYTSWMKNFSPDLFFEKELTIVNAPQFYGSDTVRRKDTGKKSMDYRIGFFPEGGNLVTGIQSKIGFHITEAGNKGIDCEGIIIDDKGDTIGKFASRRSGMGNFLLAPEANRSYHSVITLPDGQKLVKELPFAFSRGYVMKLEPAGKDRLKITVRSADYGQGPSNEQGSSFVYLFVHTRGVVKTAVSCALQNGVAEFFIDKNKLGDGISHFTVFNAARAPVCERLYFKFPEQRFQIALTTDQQQYSTREKINIHITSSDPAGLPVLANLSMAAYRLDSLQLIDEINIENYLWLSSDLTGTVESPGYYFKDNGVGTEEAMDDLMLTQGWRRFRWEDVLADKRQVFHFDPEYIGHVIRGRVTDSATRVAASGVGVYLSSPGVRTVFRTAVSDMDGMVRFDMKDFYTDGELVLQMRDRRDSLLSMEIQDPFSDKFSTRPLAPYISPVSPGVLKYLNVAVRVQNQYTASRQNQFYPSHADTIPFYGTPDEVYLLDNYVRFTTMEEVLREYVSPISVRRRSGGFELKALDRQRDHVFFESDPLILLDGVPVLDVNRILNYDPLKVRKLDLINQMYFYGNMAFEGILAFTTYNGSLQGFELDPHSMVIDYEGLQSQREFYSPGYETKQQAEERLPDFRNLLYWSPDLGIPAGGNKEISFYSSDLGGQFVVMVEGLSADGKTGTKWITFDVRTPDKKIGKNKGRLVRPL